MVTGTASCKKILVYSPPSLPHFDDMGGHAFSLDSLWVRRPFKTDFYRQCIADDMLIHGVGDTPDEATRDHEKNLTSLLKHCKEKSMRLNKEKVVLRAQQLNLMGHQLTTRGLRWKQSSSWKLQRPRKTFNRLNGTVNYLSKFLPKLSRVLESLRRLTQKGVNFAKARLKTKHSLRWNN